MKVNVITQFNKDMIKQHVEYDAEFQMPKNNIAHEIMNLKEQGVIDALIALGWTPPSKDNE